MSSKQKTTETPAKVERLACNRKEAQEMLGGISKTTMWRLEKRGLITSIPGVGQKLYSIEALRKFVNGTKEAS